MNDKVLKVYEFISFNQEKEAIIFAIIISLIIIITSILLVRRELNND